MKPHLDSDINRKIFQRSFRYFSRDLKNVERDWNKVTNYCKRLDIVDSSFVQNQTNEFLTWPLLPESEPGVEPATVETGVVEGGCRRCQHSSIAQPVFAWVSTSQCPLSMCVLTILICPIFIAPLSLSLSFFWFYILILNRIMRWGSLDLHLHLLKYGWEL